MLQKPSRKKWGPLWNEHTEKRTLNRLNNRNTLQFNKEGEARDRNIQLLEEHGSLVEQRVRGPNCLHAGWNSVSLRGEAAWDLWGVCHPCWVIGGQTKQRKTLRNSSKIIGRTFLCILSSPEPLKKNGSSQTPALFGCLRILFRLCLNCMRSLKQNIWASTSTLVALERWPVLDRTGRKKGQDSKLAAVVLCHWFNSDFCCSLLFSASDSQSLRHTPAYSYTPRYTGGHTTLGLPAMPRMKKEKAPFKSGECVPS